MRRSPIEADRHDTPAISEGPAEELDSGKLLYSLEVRRPPQFGRREPYSP